MSEQLHHLTRRMSGFDAITVVVSDMVGSGIFFTTGIVLLIIGSTDLMMGAWVLTGIVALLGAISYAELATMFPQAGGEYNYLREMGKDLLGEKHGPILGFLSGWTSVFIGFSAPMAISALGFTEYLSHFFPSLSSKHVMFDLGFMTITNASVFSIVVMLALAGLHFAARGTDRKLQVFLTVVKVAAILGLIVASLLSDKGETANFATSIPKQDNGGSSLITAFVAGMVPIWFCYTGWNASAYIASEIRNPEKNLPLSLIVGTSAVTILYLIINVVYVYALPAKEMVTTVVSKTGESGLAPVGKIAEKSANVLLGTTGSDLISIVIALSIIGALHTLLLIGPRVLFAMARDGIFFEYIADVDPGTAVPRHSIAILTGVSILMILAGDLRSLLEMAGFVLIVFGFLAVSSVFVFRFTRPELERPYKAWGYPVVPGIFLMFTIYMMYSSFVFNIDATMLGIGILAFGVPVYYILLWLRKGHFEELKD